MATMEFTTEEKIQIEKERIFTIVMDLEATEKPSIEKLIGEYKERFTSDIQCYKVEFQSSLEAFLKYTFGVVVRIECGDSRSILLSEEDYTQVKWCRNKLDDPCMAKQRQNWWD